VRRELLLARHISQHGIVGDGQGYSQKWSFKLQLNTTRLWVGVNWFRTSDSIVLFIGLLPAVHLRIKRMRAYGGAFPGKGWRR
jgi:hypothetical protein